MYMYYVAPLRKQPYIRIIRHIRFPLDHVIINERIVGIRFSIGERRRRQYFYIPFKFRVFLKHSQPSLEIHILNT